MDERRQVQQALDELGGRASRQRCHDVAWVLRRLVSTFDADGLRHACSAVLASATEDTTRCRRLAVLCEALGAVGNPDDLALLGSAFDEAAASLRRLAEEGTLALGGTEFGPLSAASAAALLAVCERASVDEPVAGDSWRRAAMDAALAQGYAHSYYIGGDLARPMPYLFCRAPKMAAGLLERLAIDGGEPERVVADVRYWLLAARDHAVAPSLDLTIEAPDWLDMFEERVLPGTAPAQWVFDIRTALFPDRAVALSGYRPGPPRATEGAAPRQGPVAPLSDAACDELGTSGDEAAIPLLAATVGRSGAGRAAERALLLIAARHPGIVDRATFAAAFEGALGGTVSTFDRRYAGEQAWGAVMAELEGLATPTGAESRMISQVCAFLTWVAGDRHEPRAIPPPRALPLLLAALPRAIDMARDRPGTEWSDRDWGGYDASGAEELADAMSRAIECLCEAQYDRKTWTGLLEALEALGPLDLTRITIGSTSVAGFSCQTLNVLEKLAANARESGDERLARALAQRRPDVALRSALGVVSEPGDRRG